MAQRTVLESFYLPLPSLPLTDEVKSYRKIKPSSQSTQNQKPLRAWREDDHSILLEEAQRYLAKKSQTNESVLRAYSPFITTSYVLGTEGDVLGACALYLCHDINVALSGELQDGEVKMEYERTGKGGTVKSDIRWSFHPTGGKLQPFAVLELKAPNILSFVDFAQGMASDDHEEWEMIRRSRNSTRLVDNAIPLSQQAMKYIQGLRIKDIGIFDWESLFLIDTSTLIETSNEFRLARGIWYREEEGRGREHSFRMVILGFLLRAMSRYEEIR